MYFAQPVWDAEQLGCTFTLNPDGSVTGKLSADGNKPEIVIHSSSFVRAALVLLFAKEERDRIVTAKKTA